MMLRPQTACGRIPLDQVGAALDVKSLAVAFRPQTIQNIAQHFFPKFADYFSRFAILEVVCEIICNISNAESRHELHEQRALRKFR